MAPDFQPNPLGSGSPAAEGGACALALVLFAPAAQAACTATGFVRDSINLTAARINPPGKISGDIDATGCNIGIYYSSGSHQVKGANVHGANYYGIVNNGANVDILASTISDIGETPFNGTQHGVAIYFAAGSAAKGNILNNTVWRYQKGGIVVSGPSASATIANNTVIGLGPVDFIAQNGIQAGLGAKTSIVHNFVEGNSYTGANQASSTGILLYGGACFGGSPTINTSILLNTGIGNDVGVFLYNADAACLPQPTPTKNTVQGNTFIDNAVNNTTGNGPTQGYQAGIADVGNLDVIASNSTCGPGYTPPGSASAALFAIDVTYTINPKLKNNVTCAGSLWPLSAVGSSARAGHHSRPGPVR